MHPKLKKNNTHRKKKQRKKMVKICNQYIKSATNSSIDGLCGFKEKKQRDENRD